MNIAQIKQIDLVDFLRALGYHPTKETAKSAWYRAPYREDRTPSFKINKDKNVWYDFGTAQSGDILNLAELLYLTKDIPKLLRLIENAAPALAPRQRTAIPLSTDTAQIHQFKHVEVVELNNVALKAYLQARGVDLTIGIRECKEIHYTCNRKWYFAIAFANNAGGYEIRNPYFKGCIAPKEVSVIRHSAKSTACCLFEGFMDYLSYLTLLKQGRIGTEASKTDGEPDCLVLNSTANLNRAMPYLKEYKTMYCYLDNDDSGRKVVDTLGELWGDKVQDMFSAYPLYKDLNDFLRDKKRI